MIIEKKIRDAEPKQKIHDAEAEKKICNTQAEVEIPDIEEEIALDCANGSLASSHKFHSVLPMLGHGTAPAYCSVCESVHRYSAGNIDYHASSQTFVVAP